jgi:HD-GYP domain-containing protein (c-di-GMP phosphodiesterase class II)
MSSPDRKISLIYFVIATLLLVGLVPLVLTGWFLSDRSGKELRAAENRYQIQLVQEKAGRIEMFGRRMASTTGELASAIELTGDPSWLAAAETENKLGSVLRENADIGAVLIKPVSGDSLAVFRSEVITRDEVDALGAAAIERADDSASVFRPVTAGSTGKRFITFVRRIAIGGQHFADVIAFANFDTVSQNIIGMSSVRDEELWRSGLPIVFVVDSAGNAVFHPDASFAASSRSMIDLKIVNEWIDYGKQVQSALAPFKAEHSGVAHDMIGAYSTAEIADGQYLGVITMQDEAKALASVGEMRNQTWLISMAFALLALIVGSIGARFMTAPLLDLVEAAKRIASGDHSTRASIKSRTEIGTLGDTFDTMADKIEEQIARLAKAAEENRELFVGTVKALAAAIDGKDKYTRGHSERVARISVAIGRRMNLPAEELETLRISALLHDVGKIAIDDNILKKPSALTDEEFEIMKQHPVRGYKIMSQIPAMKEFLPGMYMHHEMVNGKGYPQGLMGDEIPLQAKIVSVADTFDAMTIDRPYQKGMELGPALDRLRTFVDTRYQSDVVEALVEACNAGEVGQGIIRQLAEKRAAATASEVGPTSAKGAATFVKDLAADGSIPMPDEMLVDFSVPSQSDTDPVIDIRAVTVIPRPNDGLDDILDLPTEGLDHYSQSDRETALLDRLVA